LPSSAACSASVAPLASPSRPAGRRRLQPVPLLRHWPLLRSPPARRNRQGSAPANQSQTSTGKEMGREGGLRGRSGGRGERRAVVREGDRRGEELLSRGRTTEGISELTTTTTTVRFSPVTLRFVQSNLGPSLIRCFNSSKGRFYFIVFVKYIRGSGPTNFSSGPTLLVPSVWFRLIVTVRSGWMDGY
jgi:hypothetical protein